MKDVALKLALEALQKTQSEGYNLPATAISEAITAIKAALAQDETSSSRAAQEPVGVFCEDDDIGYVRLIPHQQMKLKAWDKLYTTPQQRTPLTDEEIHDTEGYDESRKMFRFAHALITKMMEKNK